MQESLISTEISQHLQNFFQDNAQSVEDSFILWNAHKAYMRGILIKLGAREKKRYTSKLNAILHDIHILESHNTISPNPPQDHTLSQLREKLRELLSQKYDTHLRRLQLNSYTYANANKAGKYLANIIKTISTKTRIAHLIHPTLKHKITNPQDIL